MDESTARKAGPAVLTDIPRYTAASAPTELVGERQQIPVLNLVLFFLTLLTTTTAGAAMAGADMSFWHPMAAMSSMTAGLTFSLPLMAILLAHEMGHYLTSRHHGVEATLPYFIPAPPNIFIIGTFGAYIRMKSPARTRRVMFDIGAAGPWAGAILAVPFLIIGLHFSDIGPIGKAGESLELGNSLLFWWLQRVTLGVDPSAVNVNLHPMAFAGWLGLFVTALNLLPVGQLDGGHVVYALFPRHHRAISVTFVISCFLMTIVPMALGMTFWLGWLVWGALAIVLGLGHPMTVDRDMPMNMGRRISAWLTVALFVATFSPVPLAFSPSDEQPSDQPQDHVHEVVHHANNYHRMLERLTHRGI